MDPLTDRLLRLLHAHHGWRRCLLLVQEDDGGVGWVKLPDDLDLSLRLNTDDTVSVTFGHRDPGERSWQSWRRWSRRPKRAFDTHRPLGQVVLSNHLHRPTMTAKYCHGSFLGECVYGRAQPGTSLQTGRDSGFAVRSPPVAPASPKAADFLAFRPRRGANLPCRTRRTGVRAQLRTMRGSHVTGGPKGAGGWRIGALMPVLQEPLG